jgi:cell division protein FtsW
MILTLFVGVEINGARRWIKIGSFSFQASEFVKPAFVVLVAWLFAENNRNPKVPSNLISALLFALVAYLLFCQPDFGQILLLAAVWTTIFFMAGMSLTWIVGMGVTAGLGVSAAYYYLPHVASRVDRYLDPTVGDTYQIDKAVEAFRAGGLLGRGPGEGTVKNYIPDAHTDFIFAVAAEEFGLIACLIIVGIFCFIVARSLMRAMSADDHFVQLAAGGLVTMFGLQAFVNIGVSLSLLPAKGMTLPFVSYGGSSLLAMALGVGMLLALTRRWTISSLTVEVTT